MKDILHIEIKNPKAKEVLSQLEEMGWIKVLNDGSVPPVPIELKKFRGIFLTLQRLSAA